VYVTADYHAFSVFLLLYAVGLCLAGWMSRPVRFQASSLVPELPAEAAPLRPAVYEP
jgi:hypothetical protein